MKSIFSKTLSVAAALTMLLSVQARAEITFNVNPDDCDGEIVNGQCDGTLKNRPANTHVTAAPAPDANCAANISKWKNKYGEADPRLDAKYRCDSSTANETKKQAARIKKLEDDIAKAKDEGTTSINQICLDKGKLDGEQAALQTRVTKVCKDAFNSAADMFTKDVNDAQAELASCTDRSEADPLIESFRRWALESKATAKKYETDNANFMQKFTLNTDATTTCANVTCSGTDCANPPAKKPDSPTVPEEPISGPTAGSTKKTSTTGGLGNMMGMAGPALAALMGMMNQQQTPVTPQMVQAAEIAADACTRPENYGTPACKCYLTGDCRNAESAAPITIGAMPGAGGAKLETPASTNLSTGPDPLVMPDLKNQNNVGGAAPGGFGGGGGGGFGGGGGGGGSRNAEYGGNRPRSGLSADILQGVRGGNSGAAGYGSRNHPGFGDEKEKHLANAPYKGPDLKQFMPQVTVLRETASTPVAVSATASSPTQMHPAHANIFVEMNKAYRHLEPTLLGDFDRAALTRAN